MSKFLSVFEAYVKVKIVTPRNEPYMSVDKPRALAQMSMKLYLTRLTELTQFRDFLCTGTVKEDLEGLQD